LVIFRDQFQVWQCWLHKVDCSKLTDVPFIYSVLFRIDHPITWRGCNHVIDLITWPLSRFIERTGLEIMFSSCYVKQKCQITSNANLRCKFMNIREHSRTFECTWLNSKSNHVTVLFQTRLPNLSNIIKKKGVETKGGATRVVHCSLLKNHLEPEEQNSYFFT